MTASIKISSIICVITAKTHGKLLVFLEYSEFNMNVIIKRKRTCSMVLVDLMIKVGIIPIFVEKGKIHFKFVSWKTVSNFIFSFSMIFTNYFLSTKLMKAPMKNSLEDADLVLSLSLCASYGLGFLGLMFPFLLSSGLSKIPNSLQHIRRAVIFNWRELQTEVYKES